MTKMEKEWRETATKTQAGKSKVDQGILDSIKTTMDDVYDECLASYTASSNLVAARKAAVTACATTKAAAWVEVTTAYDNLNVSGNEFKTCMDNLCVAEDIRIVTCGARDDKAEEAHANIPDCSGGSGTCGPTAATCETCTELANAWHNDYYTDLTTLIDSCLQESANVTEQDEDCAEQHPVYEQAWCAYSNLIDTKCDAYDECYDLEAAAYETDTANLTDLVATNINVCYATQKVKCWIDAISTCQGSTDTVACNAARDSCDITDDATFLGPCTDALTVMESDPPYDVQESCDRSTLANGVPDGGSGSWKAYWYNSNNVFHDAICDRHNRLHPAVSTCSY